jgi:hypothetical protein
MFPVTQAEAQRRVDAIDRALAHLRAEVASLPPPERTVHAQEIQSLIAAQARARNALSDSLDARRQR